MPFQLAHVAVGARVRLIGLPADLADAVEFVTKRLFEACLDKVFTITDIERGPAVLEVGEIVDPPAWQHTIEPKFLEVFDRSRGAGKSTPRPEIRD